ncbi:MAG: DNA polymerase IV [Spirochaetia bacterium]
MTDHKKIWFHIDMDAFYASVEQRDNPEYRTKPVIVGALPGQRGVVSACSYEARKFGVHSAMPISQASRLCPNGIFLPVRMHRYQEVSESIMMILKSYSPVIQQVSVDEAYMDMTGTERLFGKPADTARRLKTEITEAVGLIVSIGIAPNKFLAKLASDYDKPDGLYEVLPGTETEFLDRLPLKSLWGVGEKTRLRLKELNITAIPQIREIGERLLQNAMGKAAGTYLYRAAWGLDPGVHSEKPKSRSLSSETTFQRDTKNRDSLEKAVLDLSHQVMFRLLEEGFRSRTAAVKLRLSDFTTHTVRKTVRHWINSSEELYQLALSLFYKRWDGYTPIRLLGVGVEELESAEVPVQQELFRDDHDRQKTVEEAVLAIRRKFGAGEVVKASLLDKKRKKNGPSASPDSPDS